MTRLIYDLEEDSDEESHLWSHRVAAQAYLNVTSIFFLFFLSGTVVGVAFATFILGLVIGAVSFYMFNKHPVFHNALNYFNGKRNGQNHLTDKDERGIEMDFTKLEET